MTQMLLLIQTAGPLENTWGPAPDLNAQNSSRADAMLVLTCANASRLGGRRGPPHPHPRGALTGGLAGPFVVAVDLLAPTHRAEVHRALREGHGEAGVRPRAYE